MLKLAYKIVLIISSFSTFPFDAIKEWNVSAFFVSNPGF